MKQSAILLTVLLASVNLARAEDEQSVRFFLSGSYCAGCSAVLSETLADAGVADVSRIPPNRNGSVIVLGKIGPATDLGAIAAAVNQAETPHRKQAPPALALEVFAKLDKQSAEKAVQALAKVPGIDTKRIKAVPAAGTISVGLAGDEKLTVDQVVSALADAGIEARVYQPPAKAGN